MAVELLVHEGALHQPLAVVEDAVDLDSRDVAPQRGELALLDGRHLALGIEHVDVDAIDAEEAVGHGRPRVAAGGYEHVDLLVSALLADEVLQQARHEAGADVLEGQRGTVEELQRIDAFALQCCCVRAGLDLHDGAVKLQGVIY